ncbi:MarR family transcriptional regulator [Streptomyces coeruleorubidus]|uniref:MarR family transcriptional regulator n=1 Tax=Streptomyces coeruleorubidus TaxID=116188 RepID=UPI003CD01EF1
MRLRSAPPSVRHVTLLSQLPPEGASIAELARRLGVSAPTAHQWVHELVAMGVVTVESDPHSARSKLVRLTEGRCPAPRGDDADTGRARSLARRARRCGYRHSTTGRTGETMGISGIGGSRTPRPLHPLTPLVPGRSDQSLPWQQAARPPHADRMTGPAGTGRTVRRWNLYGIPAAPAAVRAAAG